MKARLLILIFILINFAPLSLYADQYDADRHQMKLMLLDIQKKMNDGQFDAVLPYLDKEGVVTFYDGRTAVGPDAVKAYMQQMLTGPAPVLKSFSVQGLEDVPATIYPNGVAVAHGSIHTALDFVTGEQMNVEGRWTVALIKEGNQWKIVSLHFSTNLFDNPIVKSLEKKISYIAAFSFVIGLLVGYLICRFALRRYIGMPKR